MHSLSHSLGGANPKLHHGTLNAVFLPAVIRFNAAPRASRREQRLQRMAQAVGAGACGGEWHQLAEALRELNRRWACPPAWPRWASAASSSTA